jgi:hypothetical protein
MLAAVEFRGDFDMYCMKLMAIGVIAILAVNVSAGQDRVVFGRPSSDPQILVETTVMTCNEKKLLFERVSRVFEDGAAHRKVSLSIDGVPLKGEQIDRLNELLDKHLSLMAIWTRCLAEYRDSPESFQLIVMYKRHGGEPPDRSQSRIMCGRVDVMVSQKNNEVIKVVGGERRLGTSGIEQEEPAHILCW